MVYKPKEKHSKEGVCFKRKCEQQEALLVPSSVSPFGFVLIEDEKDPFHLSTCMLVMKHI